MYYVINSMAKKLEEKFPKMFSSAEKIVIFSVAIAPVFFLKALYYYTAPKAFLITAAGFLALGCMATLWINNQSFIPSLPKIFPIIGAYALWIIITGAHGVNANASFWGTFERGGGIINFLAILFLSVALFTLLQKKDIRPHLAKAYVWGGALVALSAYFKMIFPKNPFILGEGGLIGNSSVAGAYLLFSMAAALYLFFTTDPSKKWRWLFFFAFIATSPFFANIFLDHGGITSYLGAARAATLSLFSGIGFGILLWLCYSPKKHFRIFSRIVFILSFAGLAIISVYMFKPNSAVQKIFIEGASPTRLLYGNIALEGIIARPIAGWGWNNYPVVYQKFFDPINLSEQYGGERWVDKPHDYLLEIGASAGIPGLALYLLMYGIILASCSIFIRKNYFDRKIGALFFGIFTAYFLQNLFFFDVPTTQFMFYMTVAWLFSYQPRETQNNIRPLIASEDLRKSILALVWVAALFGIFHFSYRPAKESVLLNKMRYVTVNERAQTAEKIFAISPMGKIYDESSIINEYADRYVINLPDIDDKHKPVVTKELQGYLNVITERIDSGTDYFRTYIAGSEVANSLYAYSLDKQKDVRYLELAKEYAEQAIRISPRNQLGYWDLAQAYTSSGDFKNAVKFAEMAVALEPRARESQNILLNVISLTGDRALLAEKLKQAQTHMPDFTYQRIPPPSK